MLPSPQGCTLSASPATVVPFFRAAWRRTNAGRLSPPQAAGEPPPAARPLRRHVRAQAPTRPGPEPVPDRLVGSHLPGLRHQGVQQRPECGGVVVGCGGVHLPDNPVVARSAGYANAGACCSTGWRYKLARDSGDSQSGRALIVSVETLSTFLAVHHAPNVGNCPSFDETRRPRGSPKRNDRGTHGGKVVE